jgi:hypothetical protein
MDKARKDHWLIAQGYRITTIPPIVTWYLIDKNTGMERELRGRTDDYTLNLYRGKGYVLDRKYLDPQLWNELEHGVKRPIVTVEPPEHSGTTPRLAKAIKGAVGERDFWQGTPSELLALIDSRKQGIPKDAIRLSTKVMKLHITNALKSYGITVDRKRTAAKRLLQLSHSVDA